MRAATHCAASVWLQVAMPCFGVEEPAPVCADGQEYTNACFARCDGQTDFVPGLCPPVEAALPDVCKFCDATINKPVCAGQRQFPSLCLAYCQGVQVVTDGPCAPIEVG